MASFSPSLPTVNFLLYISFFALSSPSSWVSGTLPSEPHKVSVDLYYETLCPYSANFIVNYLNKLFQDDLISIVDLHLVPWGNARISGNNNTFECQHGELECLLNTVEACAINEWPELNKHFPFIYCVENLVYKRKFLEWESCFEELNLDPKPIAKCYSSGYGKKLELQYAAETDCLKPPHLYVPWVVVDGQPLYENYEDFINYICKAYKSTDVPKACLDAVQGGKAVPLHSVSYKESKIQMFLERVRLFIMPRIMNLAAAI